MTAKVKGLAPLAEASHLNLYQVQHEFSDGRVQNYQFASRRKMSLHDYEFQNKDADAVTMFVVNKDRSKMLVTKEFRYPVNGMTISAPAGLIDPGEDAKTAAIRELKEETGLTEVLEVKVLPATYSSVGMTNERVQPVILVVDDRVQGEQELGAGEQITFQWVDRELAKQIAENYKNVTARMQLALLLFANGVLV